MIQDQTREQRLIETATRLVQREMLADRYWPKLNLEPAPPHQQAVLDAWLNGAMYFLLRWGRRSSKTVTGAKLFIPDLGFNPPGALPQRVLSHTGPNWEVTDRVFGYLRKWIRDDRIFDVDPRVVDGNRIIELPWGARTEGETTHRDSGEPDNLLGEGIVGRIGDEHARDKPNILDQYLLPPLFDTGGWIMLISTPRGKLNHLYDTEKLWRSHMEAGDKRYFVSHATSYDNPYTNHRAIEDFRIKCERTGNMDLFNQEIMAKYTSMSGAVYPMFTETKDGKPWHVRDINPIEGVPFVGGIDWGFNNPFAFLLGQVIDGDRIFIYDEICESGLTDPDQVSAVSRLIAPEYVDLLFCDPSGAGAKELFRQAGYGIFVPPSKVKTRLNSVKEGIVSVRTLLSRLDKPGIVIHSKCRNLIEQLQSYHISERAKDEKPEKIDDHCPDALRYLVMGTVGLESGIPEFFTL